MEDPVCEYYEWVEDRRKIAQFLYEYAKVCGVDWPYLHRLSEKAIDAGNTGD